MSSLFQNLLIWHVLLGLLAGVFLVIIWLGLVKDSGLRRLRIASLFGFLSILGSWFSGGYYYVNFYGKSVKPVIKAGNYPWAHGIIMETKEHIFLFLPFLALVLFLAVWLLGDKLLAEKKLRKAVGFLALRSVILVVAITLMGMLVSGAVGR